MGALDYQSAHSPVSRTPHAPYPRLLSGLVDPRGEPHPGGEPLIAAEPVYRDYLRQDEHRGEVVHPRHRHQQPDPGVVHREGRARAGGVPFIVGCIGVSVPGTAPYIASGQLSALMPGLTASGEYEILIGRPGLAVAGLDAVSMSHLLVVCLVLIGNIAYFASRRKA